MNTEQLLNLDPITARGIGVALNLWNNVAALSVQAIITGKETWDPATVAKQAYDLADAVVAEAGKRLPKKMEELINSEQ